MDREVIDLGIARIDEARMVDSFEYLYIGDCDGNVTIKLGSKRKSSLNPEEFSKIEDIRRIHYIFITNTAQTGKKLVIYFTEKKRGVSILWQ